MKPPNVPAIDFFRGHVERHGWSAGATVMAMQFATETRLHSAGSYRIMASPRALGLALAELRTTNQLPATIEFIFDDAQGGTDSLRLDYIAPLPVN